VKVKVDTSDKKEKALVSSSKKEKPVQQQK
jgi:hypothetical protein